MPYEILLQHVSIVPCLCVFGISHFGLYYLYSSTNANFLNDDKKPASEKFWELEKRIKEDKRQPGVIMELSKSEAIWDIVRLIRLKVITYYDLSEFSDKLQQEVKRILEMNR